MAELDKLNTASSASDLQTGSQYLLAEPNTHLDGTRLVFSYIPHVLQYAIFQFDGTADDVVSKASYVVRDRFDTNGPVYLMLADYQRGCWSYAGSSTSSADAIAVAGAAGQFTSPGGHTYLAVLFNRGGEFTIDTVELTFSNREPPPASWPTLGGSNLRRFSSMADVVDTANLRWKVSLPGDVTTSSPIQSDDGTVYIGLFVYGNDGALLAVSPAGQVLWQYDTIGSLYSTPALNSYGHVVIGDTSNLLMSINSGGSRIWVKQLNWEIYSSAAIDAADIAYVASPHQKLYAYDYLGNEVWQLDISAGSYSSPAITTDGTIYVGTNTGHLLAVNPNGTLRWEFEGAGGVLGSPCITPAGTILYATTDGNYYVVDPGGEQVGMYAAGGSFDGSPALSADGKVYLGSEDGLLYQFDTAAALLGTYDTGSVIKSTAVVDGDGTVFFGTSDGLLLALNPDLTVQWQFQAKDEFRSPLAIGQDGLLLAATADGMLYAFGPNDPVPPATPTGLTASQGSYGDRIRLNWDEQFDANGYEIYKDGGATPAGTVGYVTEWFDLEVADTDEHSYAIKAVNEYGSSALSAAATGYANGILPGAGAWAMLGADSAHSCNVDITGPHTAHLAWTYDTGVNQTSSSPVVGGEGEVYITTNEYQDSWVYSISADGDLRWRYTGDSFSTAVALDDEGYIYGAEKYKIFRLNPDGSENWVVDTPSYQSYGPVTIHDGVLYACQENLSGLDKTLAFDATDGTELWAASQGSRFCAPAIGSDGKVYYTSGSNRIYVLKSDGTDLGTLGMSQSNEGPVVILLDPVNGDIVLGVDGTDYLWAYQHGSLLFKYKPEHETCAGMAVQPGGQGFYTVGSQCAKLNLDGSVVWDGGTEGNTRNYLPAVDADGYIYYGRWDGTLICTAPDGTEAWTYETGGDLRYSSPAIGPGQRVYIVGYNGVLYAFDNET